MFPDGKEKYFTNRKEVIRRYGIQMSVLNELLVTGAPFHTDIKYWGGKQRPCVEIEGVVFKYTIEK